jgi:hypothetical protein
MSPCLHNVLGGQHKHGLLCWRAAHIPARRVPRLDRQSTNNVHAINGLSASARRAAKLARYLHRMAHLHRDRGRDSITAPETRHGFHYDSRPSTQLCA